MFAFSNRHYWLSALTPEGSSAGQTSFLPCLFVLFYFFETVQFLKVLLNDSILFAYRRRQPLVAMVTVSHDGQRHNDELGDM